MVQVVQDKSLIVYKIKVKAIKIRFFQVSNKSSVFSKISQINPSSSISVKKIEIHLMISCTSSSSNSSSAIDFISEAFCFLLLLS